MTAPEERTLRLGLIASRGVAADFANRLAEEMPAVLAERISDDVVWEIPIRTDDLATDAGAGGIELIDRAREVMLREGWDLAVCLTDLPLRIGRHPVVADVSATHGVGLVSLPALGAVQQRRRARDALTSLVLGLLGESVELGRRDAAGRLRVGRRIAELVAPVRRSSPRTTTLTCVSSPPSSAGTCACCPGWCARTARGDLSPGSRARSGPPSPPWPSRS
jgi:hypothetical protein